LVTGGRGHGQTPRRRFSALYSATVVTQDMSKANAAPQNVNRAQPVPGVGPRRWLILVHQLPPLPSNLRVRTWRRLQQLGAVAVKQSVYVLPDIPESREDFEWLKVEIEGAGGE